MKWQDEARVAVLEPWWRWRDGMLAWNSMAVGGHDNLHACDASRQYDGGCWVTWEGDVHTDPEQYPAWILAWAAPDLTDAATVGCLRAEVERLCAERSWGWSWILSSGGETFEVFDGSCWRHLGDVPLDAPSGLVALRALRALRWPHEGGKR